MSSSRADVFRALFHASNASSLMAGTIMIREGPQSEQSDTSQGQYSRRKSPAPQVAPQQTKRARPTAAQTTPTEATPNSNTHSILDTKDGEVCAEYMQGLATSSDPKPMSHNTYETKLNVVALHQARATAALNDLMPEIRACPPPSVLTELEDLKRELATARTKEKELEATISGLTQKNKVFSAECASYESQIVALETKNKETKQELTVARSKGKELEASISGLTQKNKLFSAQHASFESQIVSLKAENKETKQELTAARNKEKELEATISGLMHKNIVFSAQCATYERQVIALEVENKNTKQELTVAHNKEKKLGATISRLTFKNKLFSAMRGSYERQLVALNDENKKTKEQLTIARSKEKELEATISTLMHKNKVFSDQCASYESQVIALEAENKDTKEELVVADKKYYSGAKAAGYAEGIKEGKEKWLKSVEFLHHLTDASLQYFNYGFDSCQKQAKQQGFVGQLNKNTALKEAPKIKE